MKNKKVFLSNLVFSIIGAILGFGIAYNFFPNYEYGYTTEGGNKIVTRVKNPKLPETYILEKTVKGKENFIKNGMEVERMVAEVSAIVEEIPNENSNFLKKGTISINVPGYSSWEIWSDEGSFGAGDQAPCPLDYLTVGTAFCLASHLRLAAEGMGIDPGLIKVELRSYYGQYGDFGKEGTYGTTESIKSNILINSTLPQDKLMKFIQIGQNNCYAGSGFRNATPMTTKVFINGKQVQYTNK